MIDHIKFEYGKSFYYVCADWKVLGSGTYGSVYKAKKKDSKIVRAVK